MVNKSNRQIDSTGPGSDCEAFRSRYEPHTGDVSNDPHLEHCEDCRQYVEILEPLPALGVRFDLPGGLGDSLRAVAASRVGCPQADHLLEQELDGLLMPANVRLLAAHRHDCRRCRTVHSVLSAARKATRLELPADLRRRLEAIARALPVRLPASLQSPAYALAASYLLTVLLTLVLGNPYRFTEQLAEQLQQQTAELRAEVESVRVSVGDSVSLTAAEAKVRIDRQRTALALYGQDIVERVQGWQDRLQTLTIPDDDSEPTDTGSGHR